VVQEFYCCAVEAGVAAELGFDQRGLGWSLGRGTFHCGVQWVLEDVASESDAPTEGWSRSRPGEVGELDAESGGGGGEDVAGGVVSSVGRGRNCVGGDVCGGDGGQARGCAGGDGGPGADLFELGCTAVGVGDAGASELAGVAGAAGDELAVGDDAAADAGTDGDVAELVGTAAGAELPFGDRCGVGVVMDLDGQLQRVAEARAEGDVVEAGKGGRAADEAGAGFDCPEGPTPIATTPWCWAIASRIWSRMAAMT
jgi:hypothetical protein